MDFKIEIEQMFSKKFADSDRKRKKLPGIRRKQRRAAHAAKRKIEIV